MATNGVVMVGAIIIATIDICYPRDMNSKPKDAANSRLIRLYRVFREGGQKQSGLTSGDKWVVWFGKKYGRYPKLNYVVFVPRKLERYSL
jgi:hypothetical protein